jgi:hypothetical protein
MRIEKLNFKSHLEGPNQGKEYWTLGDEQTC